MMLSDDKISQLTHVVLTGLLAKDVVDFTEDEAAVRKAIKRAITRFLKEGEDMDAAARRKVESMSRQVAEGSPEWDVLYQRFFREEEVKRGRA